MNSRGAIVCEQLEARALLSASPVVEADLEAVKMARATQLADRAADLALVKADLAAIPAAITNISVSIHREESVLQIEVNNLSNRIIFDEHDGPLTLKADSAAIRKATVELKVDQARDNSVAAAAAAATLSTDESKLAADQSSTARQLASDKSALVALRASEGSAVRATAVAAVNAVAAAKAKLISDQAQSVATLKTDSAAVADAMAKLRSDAAAQG